MKKRRLTYLVPLLLMVFVFSDCKGPWKAMPKNSDLVQYTLNPNPLEVHNEEVTLNVSGTFPEEYFDKKSKLVITPIIKYGENEKVLTPVTIQGELFKDNNEDVINYKAGGTFSYDATPFEYSKEMRRSEVVIKIVGHRGGEKVEFEPKVIGAGIITTPELVEFGLEVDSEDAKFDDAERAAMVSMVDVSLNATAVSTYRSDLHYAIQNANLKKSETSQKDVQDMIAAVLKAKEANIDFKGVKISSYASPDGSLSLNTGLSKNRGNAAEKFILNAFKKAKFDNLKGSIQSETTPEDWQGFQEELDKADVPDKGLIKRVLSMYDDPEVREREIKNIAAAYTELAEEVLPQLRRSKIDFRYETEKKTDAEILNLFNTDKELLDTTELLYAATVTDDLNKKLEIYKEFTSKYPNDWRGHNNLGVVYIYKNDLDAAKQSFEKANSIEKNEYTTNNLGVIEISNEQYKEAQTLFNEAISIGDRASLATTYNLGYTYLIEGNYTEAVKQFGASNSFNAALAQLLTNDADKALNTLNSMKNQDHAMYFYLKAVVGARKSDTDIIFDNLKSAIEKDSSLKDYANNDVEFVKYFENEEFKKIVE